MKRFKEPQVYSDDLHAAFKNGRISLHRGNSHQHCFIMGAAVEKNYDTKLDTKRRLTIRNARTEYFHVTEYEDGSP